MPKCITCKKPIIVNTNTTSFFFRGKKYHAHDVDCYKCKYCSGPVTEETVRVHDNVIVCSKCYDKAYQRICANCNEPVFETGNKIENVYWHSRHFVCSICNNPLTTSTNCLVYGVLKCKNCANEERPRCAGCGKPVSESGIFCAGNSYHKQCYKCSVCQKRIKNKETPTAVNKPTCPECFHKLFEQGKIDSRGRAKYQTDKKDKTPLLKDDED